MDPRVSEREYLGSKKVGVPSLFIRLDCVQTEDGGLGVYEVEERPNGMGLSAEINPNFATHLAKFKDIWPSFSVAVSQNRKWNDDPFPVVDDPSNSKNLILVRAEPNEEEFWGLEERSISSLKKEGDKSYGEKLGLWFPIQEPTQLPWENGFVIKAKQGSKSNGVWIFHPDFKKMGGFSTRGKIEKILGEKREMYLQRFIPPMTINGLPSIYRIFFFFNTHTRQYEYVGGILCSRPNLIIHGASDSLFLPVD